jgi:hypothetical protein
MGSTDGGYSFFTRANDFVSDTQMIDFIPLHGRRIVPQPRSRFLPYHAICLAYPRPTIDQTISAAHDSPQPQRRRNCKPMFGCFAREVDLDFLTVGQQERLNTSAMTPLSCVSPTSNIRFPISSSVFLASVASESFERLLLRSS